MGCFFNANLEFYYQNNNPILMKFNYLFLIFITFYSCNNDSNSLTAKQLLKKSISVYGGNNFNNSIIAYDVDVLHYEVFRKNNISNFTLTRQIDTTFFKATYENGTMEYFVNNNKQEIIPSTFTFLNLYLDGFVYLSSIPHVFNQNAVKLKKLEDVIIKDKKYLVIHVKFTKTTEDDPENEFILYIDPNTYYVDYYVERFNFSIKSGIYFKVAKNIRIIKDITFADYFVLTPKTKGIILTEIYKLYNKNNLEELDPIEYTNITVELN